MVVCIIKLLNLFRKHRPIFVNIKFVKPSLLKSVRNISNIIFINSLVTLNTCVIPSILTVDYLEKTVYNRP